MKRERSAKPIAKELADLVDRGIHHLEEIPRGPYGWQASSAHRVFRWQPDRNQPRELGSRPSVLLSLDRVRARDAPYLHETVHVLTARLLRHERRTTYPMWREKGFASFVADEIARTRGGWRFTYMTHGGNHTVHGECAELLADPRTSGVDEYIRPEGHCVARKCGRELEAPPSLQRRARGMSAGSPM